MDYSHTELPHSISGSILPSTLIVGQAKIAVTGTAVQLPLNVVSNGVTITANKTNAANLFVGLLGVSTTNDGTGNGYQLPAGASIVVRVNNTGVVYINGTEGDFVAFIGN